jgi:hypothetical protein
MSLEVQNRELQLFFEFQKQRNKINNTSECDTCHQTIGQMFDLHSYNIVEMFNLHSCNLVEIVIIFLANVMLS